MYCRGVIGSLYFDEYLKLFHKKISAVDFRDEGDITNFTLTIKDENNQTLLKEEFETNIFYQCFANGALLKRKCFDCPLSSYKHSSDITLGDFSDAEKARKEGFSLKHLSFYSINTGKGEVFLQRIHSNIDYRRVEEPEIIAKYYPNHKTQKGSWGYNEDIREKFKAEFSMSGIKKALVSVFEDESKLIHSIENIYQNSDIYIYGAGEVGRRTVGLIRFLHNDWNIVCYVVTNINKRRVIDGLNVLPVNEIEPNEQSIVCIAVKKRFINEIVGILNDNGINNYVSYLEVE